MADHAYGVQNGRDGANRWAHVIRHTILGLQHLYIGIGGMGFEPPTRWKDLPCIASEACVHPSEPFVPSRPGVQISPKEHPCRGVIDLKLHGEPRALVYLTIWGHFKVKTAHLRFYENSGARTRVGTQYVYENVRDGQNKPSHRLRRAILSLQ